VSKAEISVKAADGDVITGGKATYTMIDETHEFSRKSKADGVFLELRGALASRPEGFLMQITTQSKEQPAGVFKAELDTARAVRDGRVRSPMLAVLYELPKKVAKNWQKPETWGLVNPHLGRSVDPEFLRDALVTAKEKGPKALQLLASQHFNVEIGVGLGGGWTGALYWKKAAPEAFGLEELIARCDVAVMGLDGGGLDDLFGLAVTGRERDTKNWLMWFHAWAHPEVLRTRKEIAPRLHDFAKAGDLTLLEEDDPTGDIEGATRIAGELLAAGLLPEEAAIGLDTVQVYSILEEMMAIGIAEDQLRYVGQDWRLAPAIWGMERKLKDGTLLHSGQGMMEWVLGNAKVEQRGSSVRMTKETVGRAKIDPLVAGMNAFTLMSRNPMAAGLKGFHYTGM
jgi:phage terminase large subunit-like protein